MNPSRSRWQAWLAAVALMVLGAVLGVTFDRLHVRGDAHAALMERVRRDPLGVMDRELKLTPEQRSRVGAILQSRQADIDRVWDETHTRLQATLDSVVNEIAAVLDSNQAVRFRAVAYELHHPKRGLHPLP
jgi:hypothetical protein